MKHIFDIPSTRVENGNPIVEKVIFEVPGTEIVIPPRVEMSFEAQFEKLDQHADDLHQSVTYAKDILVNEVGAQVYNIGQASTAQSASLQQQTAAIATAKEELKTEVSTAKDSLLTQVGNAITSLYDSIVEAKNGLVTALTGKISDLEAQVDRVSSIVTQTKKVTHIVTGYIGKYQVNEPLILVSIEGIAVSNIYKLSEGVEVSATLPLILDTGNIIKYLSTTNNFNAILTFNVINTSKTITQDVAQALNPSSGIGYGGGGVYDSANGRWWYMRSPFGLSSFVEFVDGNLDIILGKSGAGNMSNSQYYSTPVIQESGNYIFYPSNGVIRCVHKTTLAITTIPFVEPRTCYKFTSNNGATKIIVSGGNNVFGGVCVINPNDLTYSIITLTANAFYTSGAVYSASLDRLIIAGGAKIAFIDITNNVLDGVEITASSSIQYLSLSSDGSKLYASLSSTNTFDSFVLSTRVRTNISISQLANSARFIYAYNNYIYIWISTGAVIVVDESLLTYVKTISSINGFANGLIDGDYIWTCNFNGSGAGFVNRFNLKNETSTNYATNNTPSHISKHPITGQIWVGCNDSTNGLAIITP